MALISPGYRIFSIHTSFRFVINLCHVIPGKFFSSDKEKNITISSTAVENDFIQNVDRFLSIKERLKRRKPVILNESDLFEKFILGSGKGGQKVNKTSNCVYLEHKPTGLSVKCHDQRYQEANRKIARKWLIEKLDILINGDCSKSAIAALKARQIQHNKDRKRRRKLESITDNNSE